MRKETIQISTRSVIPVNNSENHSVAKGRNKSCSYLAIQCLAETGISLFQTAFIHHIENAKLLGLMPDDLKVLKRTLADNGFVMQSTRLEGICIEQVLVSLGDLGAPATIFLWKVL